MITHVSVSSDVPRRNDQANERMSNRIASALVSLCCVSRSCAPRYHCMRTVLRPKMHRVTASIAVSLCCTSELRRAARHIPDTQLSET
jgi:hypothetical protein